MKNKDIGTYGYTCLYSTSNPVLTAENNVRHRSRQNKHTRIAYNSSNTCSSSTVVLIRYFYSTRVSYVSNTTGTPKYHTSIMETVQRTVLFS